MIALLEQDTEGGLPLSRNEVLVIDDDSSVLQSILLSLREAGIPAMGFADPLAALTHASEAAPTCIIVDLMMPGIEGLDLVSALCALEKHVVILVSAFVDVGKTVDAMRLGVDDVIQKPVPGEVMEAAVRRALVGLKSTKSDTDTGFTRRERQVAAHILDGRTTKQIAQTLELSPRTIEFFRASLLKKTGSPNTAALAAALTKLGFTEH
jgi:two-component system response regulator FixJ